MRKRKTVVSLPPQQLEITSRRVSMLDLASRFTWTHYCYYIWKRRSTQRFVITEKGPARAIVKPSYNLRLKLYSPVRYKSLAPAVATLALCQWPLVLSAVSQCPWATSVPAWPVSTVSTGQCPRLVSAPRAMVTYHSPPSTALRYIGHTAPDNTHLLCSMGHNGCRV